MRQNQIFNAKVIEDSNRGFSLFRKGILKSKRPTGMSLCCLFTHATGYQAPPPILLTDDGMGWDGWDGWDGWMDGWMDGWDGMDGMVGKLFFKLISRKLLNIFQICIVSF